MSSSFKEQARMTESVMTEKKGKMIHEEFSFLPSYRAGCLIRVKSTILSSYPLRESYYWPGIN